MPRSRLQRGPGHPWPRSRAPDRTGCDAAGRGMTGIGRSALWRGVGPLGRRFPKLRPYAHGRDLPRPGLLLAAGLDVGPVLGCLRLANRVLLASSTIADLSRRSPHCATSVAHAHRPQLARPIAWRERPGGLLPLPRQICCENTAIEFSHITRHDAPCRAPLAATAWRSADRSRVGKVWRLVCARPSRGCLRAGFMTGHGSREQSNRCSTGVRLWRGHASGTGSGPPAGQVCGAASVSACAAACA